MGWVYMNLPESDADPVAFPDEPDVIVQQEALGLVQVDSPAEAAPGDAAEPDEVDIHGQGWVNVRHGETGGVARIPVEVVGDFRTKGWESIAALDAAEAKKKKAGKKSSSEPVGDDTPKEN